MTRPPYLRRLVASAVFVTAIAIEFRPITTDRMPIALVDMPAGAEVTDSSVRWLDVQPGLEPVRLPAVLGTDVVSGDPITASDVDADPVTVPSDWLRIELPVPEATANGNRLVVVLPLDITDRPLSGVVVSPPVVSDFDGPTALVAFAPQDAVRVARGVAAGTVTALLGR